jgi:hypothetical protein
MKVDINKEFAETISIAFLKELYENLVLDEVDADKKKPTDIRLHWQEKSERSVLMINVLGVLRPFLTKDELVEFLDTTHSKYYGEKSGKN